MILELLLLRLVHVLGGMLWVGAAVFTTLFLVPALASSGDGARQIMLGLQRRRVDVVFPAIAILTVLSGLRLLWIASGGFSAAYFALPSGLAFASSGAAAIVSFLLAMLVGRPAMARAGRLAAEVGSAADDRRAVMEAEVRRMRRRGTLTQAIALSLLVLGAAGMSVARYLN